MGKPKRTQGKITITTLLKAVRSYPNERFSIIHVAKVDQSKPMFTTKEILTAIQNEEKKNAK